MAIRVGILGYGNLGRGVECAVKHNPDMELKAVFTRRNPDSLSILTEGAKVCRAEDVLSMKDQIDVMILCGGSATDLPGQTPEMAAHVQKKECLQLQHKKMLLLIRNYVRNP